MDTPAPQPVVQTAPQPEAPAPEPAAPATTAPVPQAKPPAMGNRMIPVIGALIGIGILVSGILYARTAMQQSAAPVASVTPTAMPTPVPPQTVSRIATTSAFAAFHDEVASLSAIIKEFTLQDASLVPPVFDVELGL